MDSQRPIAIIGAGITGLTAAWHLARQGVPFTVFEASGRPGGLVRSVRRDGFLAEEGPNAILEKPDVARAIDGFGLLAERVEAAPAARRRYVLKNGEPTPVPSGPKDLLSTRLFSVGGRLRLLAEPLVPAAADDGGDGESVAGFVQRRLGREMLDYAVDPFVGGIFAGRPEQLSLRHAFPFLHRMEAQHGSILKGAIRERRANGSRKPPVMISFQEGMATLPLALARQLGDALRLQARVVGLAPDSGGWSLSWEQHGAVQSGRFRAVIFTLPACRLGGLRVELQDPEPLARLAEVAYAAVGVLTLGFRRNEVAHPLDGFGCLVPAKEKRALLGVSFSSSLFPGRAPEGCVTLTAYLGGARNPQTAALPAADLLSRTLADLREILGVAGEPVFQHLAVQPQAIPQYNLGYGELLNAAARVEDQNPGLLLGGSYRGGIALGDCLRSGEELATRALALPQ